MQREHGAAWRPGGSRAVRAEEQPEEDALDHRDVPDREHSLWNLKKGKNARVNINRALVRRIDRHAAVVAVWQRGARAFARRGMLWGQVVVDKTLAPDVGERFVGGWVLAGRRGTVGCQQGSGTGALCTHAARDKHVGRQWPRHAGVHACGTCCGVRGRCCKQAGRPDYAKRPPRKRTHWGTHLICQRVEAVPAASCQEHRLRQAVHCDRSQGRRNVRRRAVVSARQRATHRSNRTYRWALRYIQAVRTATHRIPGAPGHF